MTREETLIQVIVSEVDYKKIDFVIQKFTGKRWYTKRTVVGYTEVKGEAVKTLGFGVAITPVKITTQNSCRRYDNRRQGGLLNDDIEKLISVVNDTEELDERLDAVALMANKKGYTQH